MKRVWTGIALLACSWVVGVGYYHDANWAAWAILVVAGALLLMDSPLPVPKGGAAAGAVALLAAAAWLAPWPLKGAPLLMLVGLVLHIAPAPRRWPARVGRGAALAGAALLAQALAMWLYESLTARSHELPGSLARLTGAIARLVGIGAAVDGTDLVMFTMRKSHALGATWELLLDPVTLCFAVGGVVALVVWGRGSGTRKVVRAIAALAVGVLAWLPVRVAILLALYVHRALHTGYDEELQLMSQFWSPWVLGLLVAGPMLLCWRFAQLRPPAQPEAPADAIPRPWKCALAVALSLAGLALLSWGSLWDPVGERAAGRVVVDEFHSTWERTDKPYDTEWYGPDAGYNYYCIYDYCSRFYEMSRLETAIGEDTLDDCDVLIIKVPTSRYSPDEVAAVRRFVERGGGLMLMGEHTNVFRTGTHLNDIARQFGFAFRHDCLFDIDNKFTQLYRPGIAQHPIVQHMPPMHFAVSCSIEPGGVRGRAVIRESGLWSLPAEYHASNFYPQVVDRPDMRYGAFVQLWATRHGSGRVVGFTDSTIFSNFCTFEPGKPELMLGMIEWLNHRSTARQSSAGVILRVVGLLALVAALWAARGWPGGWLALAAAAMLGWGVACPWVTAVGRRAMPAPEPVRPMVQVVMDRTVCDAPLPKSGFIAGDKEGFGIFERWILRLGYFTTRRAGAEALSGDLLVFPHPNLDVSSEFRDAVAEYVKSGGRVLVIDSPQNAGSTADSLLYPYGLSVNRRKLLTGSVRAPEGWPSVSVPSAVEIVGGEAMMWVQDRPVAARATYGKGTVTVIGFGTIFTDAKMGVTGNVVPSPTLRKTFDLEFAIFRDIVGDAP